MKVAFISSHINKSLQFLWLHRELNKMGIANIHIIINTEKETPILARELESEGNTVYVLKHEGKFSHLANIFKTRALLKKHDIDIVHTTLPYGNLAGQIAAVLAGIRKRVTTCENASWAHDFSNRRQAFIDKLTFFLAQKIITGADSATEYLRLFWKIDHSKLVTIYHGLAAEDYDNIAEERIAAMRQQNNMKEGEFVIGMFARLESWKGHSFVIDAMPRILEKIPEARLYIFGSGGADQQKILSQIADSPVASKIFYKGFVNDPVAVLRTFNVHVHVPVNKYAENCGITILEGMISARPQVLTLSGYASQVARNMENSLVVDFCNSDMIAEAVLRLYRDPNLAAKLGLQARKDALEFFRSSVKAEKHINLYREL